MNRNIVFIFLLFNLAKAQTWQQLSDFPGAARDDAAAFVINNKAYCGTGLAVGWYETGDFFELDLSTETWKSIVSLPPGKERQAACGFSKGNYGYVFGGLDGAGNFLNDLWRYDQSANTWQQLSSKPGTGLAGACCFVIGNFAYVVSGINAFTVTSPEVWAFDLVNLVWIQKNNIPFNGFWRACAAAAAGKGYTLFGKEANDRFVKELRGYDPVWDTWATMSNFPSTVRSHAIMQTINYNELHVFAGQDSLNNSYNELWMFSPASSLWSQKNSLPAPGRKEGMSFVYNNAIYYSAGTDPSNTRLTETWKATFAVGIQEFGKQNESIKLYPNPAKNSINVGCNEQLNGFRYAITDALGKIVAESVIQNSSIDVHSLNNGLYQITISNNGKNYNSRFLKE